MNWAILIATLPERKLFFDNLESRIQKQIGVRNIFILSNSTGREMSIGKKRQTMLEQCKLAGGIDYISFVDDDDILSFDYISEIYSAIQSGPDVVGMRGYITFDGAKRANWIIRTKYDWAENQDGFRYVRYPNHLSPIKLEHALEAGFEDVSFAEDYKYSMRLKELGKLKNEVFIDKELYHYRYITKK